MRDLFARRHCLPDPGSLHQLLAVQDIAPSEDAYCELLCSKETLSSAYHAMACFSLTCRVLDDHANTLHRQERGLLCIGR